MQRKPIIQYLEGSWQSGDEFVGVCADAEVDT